MATLDYLDESMESTPDNLCDTFGSFLESCEQDINTIFANFTVITEKVDLENEIMGKISPKLEMVYESEKKSIFAKIGEVIVTIYEKFVEWVSGIVDKLKGSALDHKTEQQKYELLLKRHPDLKNEIVAAFNSGALDLADVKSLKELESTYDEVMKMIRHQNIDLDTVKGRWEKAKEKFDEDEKKWKVVKVAAATGTVVSAALAVKTFIPRCKEAKNNAEKIQKDMNDRRAALVDIMEKDIKKSDRKNVGLFQYTLAMYRELIGKSHLVIKNQHTILDMITAGLDKVFKFYAEPAGKNYVEDLKRIKKNNKTADKQKAIDDYANRKDAESKYYEKNKETLNRQSREQAEARKT